MKFSISSLKEPSVSQDHKRIQIVDIIKGVDIIFMVMFNYSVTLSYFGLIFIPSGFLYQLVLPVIIASIFIFLSGVTAHISYQKRKENFNKRYQARGLKLMIFAMFITLFSHIFVPEKTIFFGILHFFAISSFIVPLFIRFDLDNLIAALLIILSGFYLQYAEFNFSYLLWLGFMPENFSTFDYFPLLPWLGVLLLGIYSGEYVVKKANNINFKNDLAGIFTVIGKNSLTIYLVHQPLLIFLLVASGYKLF